MLNCSRLFPHVFAALLVVSIPSTASVSTAQEKEKSKKKRFYDPVIKKIEGFEIAVDPALLKKEQKKFSDRVFKSLANHLQRVEFILPRDRLEKLRNCKIWIELDNPKIRGMLYHPGRGWLLSKDLDPRLVKHVHIPQAKALLDRQQWAKHPYVILHELAHSFHDQVYGFDNKEIKDMLAKLLAGGGGAPVAPSPAEGRSYHWMSLLCGPSLIIDGSHSYKFKFYII